MSEMLGNMQGHLKKTSSDVALFGFKFVTGAVLGLTFGLIMQEAMGKGEDENILAFLFVIIVTLGAFMRISKNWGFTAILIFDLVTVLVGLVLRLYIMVAPGA